MKTIDTIDVVLASQSPRRKDLLRQAGFNFTVCPAEGEEIITSNIPSEVVEELSLQKALEVADRSHPSGGKKTLYIGADTVVAIDHRILGKPADREEARAMITELQGRTHQVFTGVTLVLRDDGSPQKQNVRTFHECTDVHVFPMSEEEIDEYISTDEPYDKAGAYGIQGDFGIFIEKINGDYNNVVGLPIARLYHEVQKLLQLT